MTTPWTPRTQNSPTPDLTETAARLEISPFLASLLWQRGFTSAEDMALYLAPNLRHLMRPVEWPGLAEAAAFLASELLAGRTFLVWGDYDVDGITATALVKEFLAAHGFSARHHIPSRLVDGYGLTPVAMERLHADGVELLLTVDCGISDVAAVERARELGMTVVISDHHLPGDVLPPAHAVCNPRITDSDCRSLAGVGVAFMLMAALNSALVEAGRQRVDMRPLLDLVALGTLADVVELSPQNRILAKNGMLTLASGARPGIAALKNVCNQTPSAALTSSQVVYMLAPRINAAGRLGKSELALELLLTRDRAEAARLAGELDELNAARREEEKRILEEAMLQAQAQAEAGRMGLVVHAPHWHPGIIGIVASRIVDALHRPTVVLCDDRLHIKGSGRSVAGFDLHAALTACSDLFLAFGGHRQAAGVTLAPGKLQEFARRFDERALEALGTTPAPPQVSVDCELPFNLAADFTLLKELELLQPFGPGNPEPVFSSPPVEIKAVHTRPGGLTLMEFTDQGSGITLRAKSWNGQKAVNAAMKGSFVRLAYTPRIDRYNGAATVDLKLRDWMPDTGASDNG